MNEIFICNWGNAEFSDSNHLTNFIKYLFSKSKSHKKSNITQYNFYKRKVDSKFKTGFLENNELTFSNFLQTIKLENHNEFTNDLYYIFFIIIIDNNLITNLFNLENDTLIFNITDDLFSMIINDYFHGDENNFYNKMNHIIAHINTQSLNIINYDNLINNAYDKTPLVKEIEIQIHKSLQQQYFNENVIFQISHNDQHDKPYHIHRLIYEKEN